MLAALLALSALADTPSVHADHAAMQLGRTEALPVWPEPRPLPEPTNGPDVRVYGYHAYWSGELADMPWDHLSDIALFSADVDTAGNLSNTSRWGDVEEAVAIADAYGVRVHLCITNFSSGELETLLGSASARDNLIADLKEWVDSTGADGVNVDFENLPSNRRSQMVQFITDLDAAVDDVVIATPSVDWSDAWDYAALTDHADLFIMGYGYHWSGSDSAGPVDPLWGGGMWSPWSLDWSVQDYTASGADPERIILGLPLYGISWPTVDDSVPGPTTGTGSSVVWTSAQAAAATHGRRFEGDSVTPWYYDGSAQTWYSDTDSVAERIAYANGEGIGGVGFWALHYDGFDTELWDSVRDLTTSDDPDDPDDPPIDPDFTAQTGRPFLAYVGDVAIISGANSEGPSGLSLTYDWTQTAGPPVELIRIDPARPQFLIEDVGTHAFELRVGDGTRWSAPESAYVIVLDPDAGRRHSACGCATAGAGGWAWLGLLGAVLIRRRNR